MRLSEYPRPQFVRDSFINLNGEWECQILKNGKRNIYSGTIQVPYSPEAKYSGVNHTLLPNEELWYRKKIHVDDDLLNKRLILNFGAVDQICEVFVGGKYVGKHVGGYTPFSFDITDYLCIRNGFGEAMIEIRVKDYTNKSSYTRGKQSLKPKGIFYHAQSGIWQTVWMEVVPERHIKDITITTDVENKKAYIHVKTNHGGYVGISFDNRLIYTNSNETREIDFNEINLWSPENPHLYNVTIRYEEDEVKTYFAFRKIETKIVGDIKTIYLNGEKVFLNGILEQGYYGENLYTPDSYDTVEKDIILIKEMGFNTIRKHIKIEPAMYYYLCDKYGMLVIQDMVNGGGKINRILTGLPVFLNYNVEDNKYGLFNRNSEDGKKQFEREIIEVQDCLSKFPSIIAYTIFNEGWGQYDTKRIYEMLKNHDSSKLYDANSGWFDQGVGDFKSIHCYFKKYRLKPDDLKRAIILSEYGGYSYGKDTKNIYTNFKDEIEYLRKIGEVLETEIRPNIERGLTGSIYTQYNDIEEEQNGLVYANRTPKSKKVKGLFKI